jgi:hypothetical protein
MFKRAKLATLTITTKAKNDNKNDNNKMIILGSIAKNEDKDEVKAKKKEVK